MDSAETPLHGMEGVEAAAHAAQTDDRLGTGPGASPAQRLQWPWTMVELRHVAHEHGAAHCLLSQTGFDLTR
jgi:hypothetical protein